MHQGLQTRQGCVQYHPEKMPSDRNIPPNHTLESVLTSRIRNLCNHTIQN